MYKNIFSFRDKIALVTGGTGLIGAPVVRALSDFGAGVYSADIGNRVRSDKAAPGAIRHLKLDISSENSVEAALKSITHREKHLDILINCAYPKTKDWGDGLEKTGFASWKKNVNAHMGGYFLTCRSAAEMMKKQETGGAIINFASIYGMVAPDFGIYEGAGLTMPPAYAAIKSGIIGISRYLASYYGKYNIRVNTISPGGVWNNQHPAFVRRYAEKTVLGRMAAPADIVGAVIYLASDAARYVTGINLVVDGGWTVR